MNLNVLLQRPATLDNSYEQIFFLGKCSISLLIKLRKYHFLWLRRRHGWEPDKMVEIYINDIADQHCDTSNKITGNKNKESLP